MNRRVPVIEATVGMTGTVADQMAGMGMVMMSGYRAIVEVQP